MKVRLVIGPSHADKDPTSFFVELPCKPSVDDIISVVPNEIPADWLERLKIMSSRDPEECNAFRDLSAMIEGGQVKTIAFRIIPDYRPNWTKDSSGVYVLIVSVWPHWHIT